MKQKDLIGAPEIWFEQEANLFDVSKYNYSAVYMYNLGKQITIDPTALDPTTYIEVVVAPNEDITWRELAWRYMGKRQDAWWAILIFNGVQDATIFPCDLCPDAVTSVNIKIPTESAITLFLFEIQAM